MGRHRVFPMIPSHTGAFNTAFTEVYITWKGFANGVFRIAIVLMGGYSSVPIFSRRRAHVSVSVSVSVCLWFLAPPFGLRGTQS